MVALQITLCQLCVCAGNIITNAHFSSTPLLLYNGLRFGEGCLTDAQISHKTFWQLLPNRCYVLGGLSALHLIKNEMKVLHITPSTNGYEEVTLLANRISKTNGFSAIEKNGEQFMTGGFLIKDTPQIRAVLDAIPKEEQYKFVTDFKIEPFVKCYLEY